MESIFVVLILFALSLIVYSGSKANRECRGIYEREARRRLADAEVEARKHEGTVSYYWPDRGVWIESTKQGIEKYLFELYSDDCALGVDGQEPDYIISVDENRVRVFDGSSNEDFRNYIYYEDWTSKT